MFQGKITDGKSGHCFMLREEPVVRFVMSLEEDRDVTSQERAVVDGVLPVDGRREDGNPSATGGWVQGDTIRATTQICCLKDEAVGLLLRRVDEGVGEVVEMSQVDVGHEDVNVVRANRLLEVLRVQGLQLRARSRETIFIIDRDEILIARCHQRKRIPSSSCSGRRDLIAGTGRVVFKNELLGVFFFLIRANVNGIDHPTSSLSHQNNEATDSMGVIS
jgi:hypothetical protein